MNAAVFAETVRRHVTSAGYIAFIIIVAMIGMFAATFNMPASMWPSLTALLAIVIGATIVGPEFSTGALQLIVSKPVRRDRYVLSRVAGVFASVAIAAITGAVAETFGRLLIRNGPIPFERIANGLASALFVSLLTIALLTMLGSVTRAYYNVAIYLGVSAFLSMTEAILGAMRVRGQFGAFLQQHPGIERGLATVDDVLFPSTGLPVTGGWVLQVVVTAAIALTIACIAFERREVPYGAE